MKITFLNSNIGYGGASKILVGIANYLSDDNQVTIVTYENNEVLQYVSDNINIVHLQTTNNKRIIRRFHQFRKIKNYLKENKPDILIAFLSYSKVYAVLSKLFIKTKVILSERGDPSKVKGLSSKLFNFIYNFSDGFVFQTQGAMDFYGRRIKNKSVIIPNPVFADKNWIPYEGERKKVIVNVARFELKQKRQDVLLEAFAKITDKFPEYKLVLYGDGEDKDIIEDIIEKLNIKDRVVLAGVTNNVYEAIKKAELFVLSSDYEGIPNAVIEAMSMGVPVISTDCSPGGARLLIENGKNGIKTERGNSDILAGAIVYMLENKDKAKQMSVEALKITEKFSEEKIYKMWENYLIKIKGESGHVG
jgi:glycosyltransferase involved in cell wall biosynthesis